MGISRRRSSTSSITARSPPCPSMKAFAEYARIVSDGKPVLWLIDMSTFNPLGIDGKTRKAASGSSFAIRRRCKPHRWLRRA